MDLLSALKVSSSALSAHRTKINVIAENIANSETTRTAEGGPYRRKMVVFEEQSVESFKDALSRETDKKTGKGVRVDEIVQSQEDFRMEYNPAHPDADPATGYVAKPNVDTISEMADMMVARRSYDASATVITNTREMILKTLELGK